MQRDMRRLADERFDLAIVGAGFYGAVAAWDGVLRGLSVALIDKGDFGSGTSFNNLKTLHGGLRSLQSLNFAQMRLFVRERRALARVAPHLVRPLPFVVPTYNDLRRSALVMRVALALTDVVSRDRHAGLSDPSLQLPPGEVVSRERCLELNPLITPEGVTGGAVWHDYQLENTDRMTLAFVLSASNAGAAVANYVRATGFARESTRVVAVRVEDALSGNAFDIRAKTVLNAAGPWAPALVQSLDQRAAPNIGLSRAMNLVTRAVAASYACGGLAGGRFLFMVPWRSMSVLGTSHDVHTADAETLPVTTRDVECLLRQAAEAFPRANLTADDVQLVHRGLLPMIPGRGDDVTLLRESLVIDHAEQHVPGLISMIGVRYTTARHTASRAIDCVFKANGHAAPPCRTDTTPVTGGDIAEKERFLREVLSREPEGLSEGTLRRLALTYGTKYDALVQIMRREPALGAPLGLRCAVTGAEIVHAVRSEAAVKLSDALIRRTEAGSAGHPGDDALARAAEIVGHELGWSRERQAAEIAEVEAFYAIAPG